jgi:hypothetical protein
MPPSLRLVEHFDRITETRNRLVNGSKRLITSQEGALISGAGTGVAAL